MKPPLTGLFCCFNSGHIKKRRPTSTVKQDKRTVYKPDIKCFVQSFELIQRKSRQRNIFILELHFSPLYNQMRHIVQMVSKTDMFCRIRLPVLPDKHNNTVLNFENFQKEKKINTLWFVLMPLKNLFWFNCKFQM